MSTLGRSDTAAAPAAAPATPEAGLAVTGPIRPLAEARTDFEKAYIRRALSETGGNITKAAELLGLARENLSRKIKQLGLDSGS
jgi:arginine utilization regulatory protein